MYSSAHLCARLLAIQYLAQQLELNGVAAMSFWLWDEQVALDYLASLPYVDSSKLGVRANASARS